MPMRNRIRRAGLHTISTKNTSIVVDVVNAGVALGSTDAVRLCVFSGFDVDAVRGAGGGTEKTGHALLQPVFITLQHVHPAEALLEAGSFQRARTVGIIFDLRGLEHLHEGDAHTL